MMLLTCHLGLDPGQYFSIFSYGEGTIVE